MENIYKKSIFEQLFESRKEDFEQGTYDTNKEIREIEEKVLEKEDNLTEYVKQFVPEDKFAEVIRLLNEIELAYGDQEFFWSHAYYNLGISDVVNFRNSIKKLKEKNAAKVDDNETFLDYSDSEFDEYIIENSDYTSEKYKELRNKYREITDKYPNVTAVYDDLEVRILSKEEMKALLELRQVELDMRSYENKICFKLGIKEIINF